MSMSEPSVLRLYSRVLREARPYRLHIAGMLLLSLLSTPLALLAPLPLKIAVDSVLGSEPTPGFLRAVLPDAMLSTDGGVLLLAAALAVVVALLSALQGLSSGVLHAYTGQKLVMGFRARLFRHAQRLSLSYHDSKGTSSSTYRIQYDAPAMQWIAVDGIIPFVTNIFKLAATIYVTARISLPLAAVALAVSPVLFLVSRVYGRRLRGEWRGAKKLDSSVMSVVQEVLAGVRVVKAFGQEDREQQRFLRHADEGARAQIRLAFLQGGLGLLVGTTTAVGGAVVLYVGVRQVQSGALSLGNLILVMSYLSQLYRPLETMSEKVADLQSSLVSAERAFALLDEAPDVVQRSDARPLPRARGAVAFRDVSFAYDGKVPVLRGISFEVAPGARVGIAGTTGAGKTTLVGLLTRFYDPTQGCVLLDGVDLRDYKLADLRNQFAIVLQEPVLFSTSIAENIAYAKPSASREEIVAAATAANAHDFVSALAEGYDTLVGERGMRLSGGERQRISLARAFLKDAPVLILDEPTSSVDTRTEAIIMEAMERLMRGRTTFMIAHRLSTLEYCDTRLVIERGRLAGGSPSPDGQRAFVLSRRVEGTINA